MKQIKHFWLMLCASACLALITMVIVQSDLLARESANVIRVSTAGTDFNGCGSESQPCRTLQFALNAAQNNDEIRVAQGTYTGGGSEVLKVETNFSRSLTVKVIGGYANNNWQTPSADASKTVIDGQNSRRGIDVVADGGSTLNLHLQNLAIMRGFVNNSDGFTAPLYVGAGLRCRDNNGEQSYGKVKVSMYNVLFKENTVQGTGGEFAIARGGGADFAYGCIVDLEQVTFDSNKVYGGNATDGKRGGQAVGGGLNAGNATIVTARNVTFVNNLAQAGDGGTGFGLGTADGLGGGASFQLNTVTINGVTVTGNKAIGGGNTTQQAGTGSGAGLFFELNLAECTVTDGIFRDNIAQGGSTQTNIGGIASGGGLMGTDVELKMERLQFYNNQSIGGNSPNNAGDAGGGALYFANHKAQQYTTVVNGTNLILANNTAKAGEGKDGYGGGGAIFNEDGNITLTHSTLSGNSVTNHMQGPAITSQHIESPDSRLEIKYSIIANHNGRDIFNNPRAPIVIQKDGDIGISKFNLFFNNTKDLNTGQYLAPQPWTPPFKPSITIENSVEGDPQFVSPNSPNYSYKIMARSAAIDKATGSTTNLDFEKNSRPSGSANDLGADEFVNPLKLVVVPSNGSSLMLHWSVESSTLPELSGFKIISNNTRQGTIPAAQEVTVDAGVRSYMFDGLQDGKQYTFTIQALDKSGNPAATSETASGTPVDNFLYVPYSTR